MKISKIIKSKREIELLKKSATITNSCIPLIEKSLRENKITEKELARMIRKKMKKQGATEAFRTIVACGKRSAKIHAKPRSTNKIISGMGYADFGANYKGYRSDITVPFVKGKIGKRERKIVHATLQAYELAIRSIKLGGYCWKAHERVNKFLMKRGFEMKHGLGHGIGLKTHEMPFISKLTDRQVKRLKKKKRLKWKRMWKKIKDVKFQPGMVFTIEPAVYVKGIGGCRIENDVLITKRGIKILTNSRLIEVNSRF